MFLLFLLFFNSCEQKPQLPVIDFVFENHQECPVMIEFTNNSKFADKYIWDFGDGQLSNVENPTNYYIIPGEYTVSLRAFNSEGSNTKKELIKITGTTYRVSNECTNTLTGAFGFYLDGNTICDMVGFPGIFPDDLSAVIYTKREKIILGIHYPNGNTDIVVRPYIIVKDENNILEINDFTEMRSFTVD